ncbi:11909_t:CDS:2, partial [Funneliformis geosporum]
VKNNETLFLKELPTRLYSIKKDKVEETKDQLCIIQEGEEATKDKENEIPKMRQYYSNAEVTLIALDDEVGDVNNTSLIDILTLNQASYTDVGKYNSRNEFNKGTKKIATP